MFDSKLLVISDDPTLIEGVRAAVAPVDGLSVRSVADLPTAQALDDWDRVALALIHLKDDGPDSEVVRLVRTISAAPRPVPTLVIADRARPDQADALLRQGVADYLGRPLDVARLADLVGALTDRAREGSARPVGAIADRPVGPLDREDDDPVMEQVRRVAPQDATILLGGETGTGKTRLARRIHELSSRRAEPFVVVHCGSLGASRLETELFGDDWGGSKSDRTGKLADVGRGTLFLDEVDALPMAIQSRLLRAVEDRCFETAGGARTVPIRARLIVASNLNLEEEVAGGRFRSDLYYRINVIGLQLAPLRERRGEIEGLARRFVAESAALHGREVDSLSAAALTALREHDWPGNIRELKNTIERAVSLANGREIQVVDLPDPITRQGLATLKRTIVPQALSLALAAGPSTTLAEIKRDAELARITEALHKHSNNRLRAASELGISRMTLYKKLYKYGLMSPARAGRDASN